MCGGELEETVRLHGKLTIERQDEDKFMQLEATLQLKKLFGGDENELMKSARKQLVCGKS